MLREGVGWIGWAWIRWRFRWAVGLGIFRVSGFNGMMKRVLSTCVRVAWNASGVCVGSFVSFLVFARVGCFSLLLTSALLWLYPLRPPTLAQTISFGITTRAIFLVYSVVISLLYGYFAWKRFFDRTSL